MRQIIPLLLAVAVIAGCATGSHVITGRARPMTSPDAVKIYPQMPAGAEVLGTVTVNNPNGFSHTMGSTDEKVLRQQAAKMGANGLIIGGSEMHVGRYETSGIAIWVP